MPTEADQIDRIRSFNRLYTSRIGVVCDGLHGSTFSLSEARILYEIAVAPGTTAGAIRGLLDLDAGYLSRTIAKLEDDGLVTTQKSDTDGRMRELRLSSAGLAAFATLETAARASVSAMLADLPKETRDDLVGAMDLITSSLRADAKGDNAVHLRPHRSGDLGWVIERHAVLYAREYGWGERFEAMVTEIAASFLRDHDPAREICLIAERNGARLGSAMVVNSGDGVAKLRLVLVEPEARGLGLGRLLVGAAVDFTRQKGYRRMDLWTNSVLAAARHLYERAGFRLVEEAEHDSFGPTLVGQTWSLDLRAEAQP